MSRFRSEELSGHDRTRFRSGNDRIDSYFRTIVSQDVKRGFASCFVLVDIGREEIAGFYTLSAGGAALSEVPRDQRRKLPPYSIVPLALIGWLGRDQAYRGQSVGPHLLLDAIRRVDRSDIAAYAIAADAIDQAAQAFYAKHHFLQLTTGRMFLPLKDARVLLAP